MPDKSNTKEIIVTGAHRSGTSAISNFLVNLGIDAGDPQMLLKQAKDNQKGFFERHDVMSLNDGILECANSSWHHLDFNILNHPEHLTVTDDIKTGIQTILGSFISQETPFLLKDPRFSLTLPVWLKYLSQPLVIVCLRNPLEIARSLQKRNGFSIYKCLAIWEAYLLSLSQHSKKQKCIYVNFNKLLEDPEKYGKCFVGILSDHGIKTPLPVAEAIASSFDVTLKHEECSDQDLEILLSVRQMALWKNIKEEPRFAKITDNYWVSKNFEAMRQKDTDTGYSTLEIQLFTECIDGCQAPNVESLLVAQNEQFIFDVNSSNVQSFRLLPLNKPCIIRFISFDVMSSSGAEKRVPPASMNGFFEPKSEWLYFPQDNPEISYKSPFVEVAKVKITLLFATLETDVISQLLIKFLFTRNERYSRQLSRKHQQAKEKDLLLDNLISQRQVSKSTGFSKRLFPFYQLVKMASKPREFWSFIKYYQLITKEPSLFLTDYYCNNNRDVNPFSISPLLHFLVFGWKEGRDPSPDFNVKYYLEANVDVKERGLNPLLHYISKGWKEGRNPSPTFITNKYIAEHPGILSSSINPLVHQRLAKNKASQEKQEVLHFKTVQKVKTFTKPVAVIIPVYLANEGAISTLQLLLSSLIASYPVPSKNLNFIVLDDASPIKSCRSLLSESGFFDRADVKFLENVQSLGFTGTINRGIGQVSKRTDVIILNSDTEIHGSTFEILQQACYRKPHIGSVTPLSNRATIFSLLDWPFGTDNIYGLKPKEISEIIEGIGLVGPSTGAPTGHGFCMYMSRRAINATGLFDSEVFGQGYGEENDWSMRALQAGYTHHFCTECFVYHHESKSFETQQKARLQKENTEKLNKLYPYYAEMVQKYLNDDPSKQHRKLLKLFLLEIQKRQKKLQTVCFVLHDSYKNHEGVVQQHVKQLLNSLSALNQFEFMVISPDKFKGELYELHLFQEKEVIGLSNLNGESLTQILSRLENRVDFLHVHHIHGLQKIVVDWVENVEVQKKILTIHDYDFFCSNPFLLNDNGSFCLANGGKKSCENKSCQSLKEQNNKILNAFDLLFVPSNNCKRYVNELADDLKIQEKINVLPHFLPFVDEIPESAPSSRSANALSKNIVFLGSLYPHKGGEMFLESIETIHNRGFETHVWGHAQESFLATYINVPPIVSYKNWRELLELYQIYGVHIVVIPAVCAETFSYTLFEALFLFEVPVVVGPYGNPSELVQQHGVGEVLPAATPGELVSAIARISENYEVYLDAVKKYKENFYTDFATSHYLEKYTKLVFEAETKVSNPTLPCTHPEGTILSGSSKALMNKALKIQGRDRLCVLFVHGLSEQNPPFFFRVENPTKYLEKTGSKIEIYHLDNIPLQADQYDLIFLSRTPLTDKLDILLRNAKAIEIPVILDVDDLIFHSDFLKHFSFLNTSSPEYVGYEELLQGLEKTFVKADVLLGSTPGIAAAGEKYGKRSIYFRNMLRLSHLDYYKKLYKTRPQFKEPLIGYFAGSSTHEKDLEMLTPVFEKIFKKHPQTKLLLVGFVQNASFKKQFTENLVVQEFDNYNKYLETVRRCKVMISPIAEMNDFSQAKSNIKFLEAAAVGTPLISSPINEMRHCIENGVTGWLAGNEQEWLQHIETAIIGEYADYVGECANAYVMERYADGSSAFCNIMSALVR